MACIAGYKKKRKRTRTRPSSYSPSVLSSSPYPTGCRRTLVQQTRHGIRGQQNDTRTRVHDLASRVTPARRPRLSCSAYCFVFCIASTGINSIRQASAWGRGRWHRRAKRSKQSWSSLAWWQPAGYTSTTPSGGAAVSPTVSGSWLEPKEPTSLFTERSGVVHLCMHVQSTVSGRGERPCHANTGSTSSSWQLHLVLGERPGRQGRLPHSGRTACQAGMMRADCVWLTGLGAEPRTWS